MTDKLSITFASKLIEQFAAWFQKLEKLGEFFPFRDFELVHVLQLMSDIDAFLTDPKLLKSQDWVIQLMTTAP